MAAERPSEAPKGPDPSQDPPQAPKGPQSAVQRFLDGVQTFMSWAEEHGYTDEADKAGSGYVKRSVIEDAIAEARILGDRKISAPERNAWHEALNTIHDLVLKKD